MLNFLKRLAGDHSKRILQRLQPIVDEINSLEPEMRALSNDGLRALTEGFRAQVQEATQSYRERIRELEAELDREPDEDERRRLRYAIEDLKKQWDAREREVLDAILPRAFAAVREASVRTIGLRHFDEQLLGGIVLHRNMIAEMKTGEGKTLVATLPLYLNALTGRGVHLVTPNDYLSKVGVQWMGPIYHLLGLSVGVIQSMGQDPAMSSFLYDPDYVSADDRYQHLRPCARAEAYRADITYGTNNEFGFDYLRDNMVLDIRQCVMRELYYAIVDEVDNILIDEARTPLIISGEAEESTEYYKRFAQIVARLREGVDYTVDEKRTTVTITEEGLDKVERALGIDNLYAPEHYELTPYLENALRAKALFQRDRHYVVVDGQVIIVDEFTGRLMYGRRYSEGLHQAIEAKEGVRIQRESLTLATITFQNFFRMYRRLAGMTGTAETEAEEFAQIYNLDVVVIPTHEPMRRVDYPDVVYKTAEAKYRAVLEEIKQCYERKQPVLVGTLAIETSEMLSQRLKRMGIPHQVLNAKYHEREAQIIAQAGRPGAVTIATNMAGRGVDILLGGNPEGLAREALRRQGKDLTRIAPEEWQEALEAAKRQCEADRQIVLAAGGLHIIGTERYEARRIDNQLRGRAGRQGDPGSSRFYVSLEDDLMRRFGGEAVARLMDRLGVEDDVPIEHNMVTKAIANAQVRVEGYNFDLRKHLLEYDDVVNQQRQVIYDQRRLILSEADLKPVILDILHRQLDALVDTYATGDEETWDLKALHEIVDRMIHLPPGHRAVDWQGMTARQIKEELHAFAERSYDEREQELGPDLMRQIERVVMLRSIDNRWVRHLTALDELREGIGLRAIGQRDPLVEYKREAFQAFEQLLNDIQADIANFILNVQVARQPVAPRPTQYAGASGGAAGSLSAPKHAKVGRNDPCPCGSGKKYKNCCLRKGLSPEEAAAQRGMQGQSAPARRPEPAGVRAGDASRQAPPAQRKRSGR
ncbi:MAG: preprotein translocase subunit SecA [Chloroflexi bacterium]|nr:preprotein translocase subunit SecA [Chloroflexota bacterium]